MAPGKMILSKPEWQEKKPVTPQAKVVDKDPSKELEIAQTSSNGGILDTQVASRKKTGFLDLPPEIRNKICKLLLPKDRGFRITRHPIVAPMPKIWMDRITIGRKVIRFTVKGTAIVMNGRKRRRLPIGEVYPLSILLVSQKINVEAGAMVLGNNRFTFETDLALTEFKAAARSKFAFLRDIVVEDMISEHKDLLPPYYHDVWKNSETIWDEVKPFVMTCAEWQIEASSRGGSYRPVVVEEVEKQKERLMSLVFAGGYGKQMICEDGTKVTIKSLQHGHELFQPAVLKRWEKRLEDKQTTKKKCKKETTIVYSGKKVVVKPIQDDSS